MNSNINQQATPIIAIGAIFKNEAPYVLEWIAFHRSVGVGRFFIADNDSDDGTTQLLAALARIGIVEHIHFPSPAGKAPQLPAYAEIMRRFARQADWIAFVDADEFLVPLDGSTSIISGLANWPADTGAVAVNWAVYGSSFRMEPSSGLVLERFTRRSKDKLTTNHHYKTLLRTSAYKSVHGNPHLFKIKDGFRYVHVDGSEVIDHPKHGPGLSSDIHWQPFRINHYVVKSRAEFDRKKAPRGRATSLTAKRENGFFIGHDRNEVEDPAPAYLIDATREEMQKLRQRLRENGCDESLLHLDETIADLKPVQHAILAAGKGAIDEVFVSDGFLTIRGWALSPDRSRPASLGGRIGKYTATSFDLNWQRRDDVCRKFEGAQPDCGFRIKIPLGDLPDDAMSSPVIKIVLKNRRSMLRLVSKKSIGNITGSVTSNTGTPEAGSLSTATARSGRFGA